MLTYCKLSNISYNSDEFLKRQLNTLLESGKISYWAFINHQPEEDEKKPHKHLIIFPDVKLETRELDTMFLEEDPTNDKPLKCMLWNRTSSINDWYLYALHDATYLKLKYGEDVKIHYSKEDIISSDEDITNDLIYNAYHLNNFWKSTKWQKFVNDGLSASDIVKRGYIAPSEMTAFHHFVQIIGLTVI